MTSYPGVFIALEGLDGSGKSTQLEKLNTKLSDLSILFHTTSEPTNSNIGNLCRQYLSDPTSTPSVDALLFAADRIEHYEDEVLPKLKDGYLVITDRYKYSSIVYQGSQGVDINWIEMINSKVPDPDVTIYLEISVEEALKRLEQSGRTIREKFETENYLKKLESLYENIFSERWYRVDAEQQEDAILEDIVEIIDNVMSK